jgi:hypothetical protein
MESGEEFIWEKGNGMSKQQSKSDGVMRGKKNGASKKSNTCVSAREKFWRALEANRDAEETNETIRRRANKKFNSVSELMKACKRKK